MASDEKVIAHALPNIEVACRLRSARLFGVHPTRPTSANFNRHNRAISARRSCLGARAMASRVQGAIRDCPVRLRLKDRVHALEQARGRYARNHPHHHSAILYADRICRQLRRPSTSGSWAAFTPAPGGAMMMGALGVKGQSNQGLFKKGKAVDLAQSLKRSSMLRRR